MDWRLGVSKQDAQAPPPKPDPALANLSLQISVVFSVLSVITFAVAPSIDRVYSVISAILFIAGTFILGLGFWNGIQRSRVDDVRLAGLLAVDKSFVPAAIRNRLWAAVVLQIVVSFTLSLIHI